MRKILVPQFDNDLNHTKDVIVTIKNKPEHKDAMKIYSALPGIPQGYCADVYKLGNGVNEIELTRFYDIRQGKGLRKLKGYYIKIV